MAQAQCPLRRTGACDQEVARLGIGPRGFLTQRYAFRSPLYFGCDEQVHPDPIRIVEVDPLAILHVVLHARTNTAAETVELCLVLLVMAGHQGQVIDDTTVGMLRAAEGDGREKREGSL